MSLDDATRSYIVEFLSLSSMSDTSFVHMLRWSSLINHDLHFSVLLLTHLSRIVLDDSRVQLFSVLICRVSSSSHLFSCFFPRCYQRSIVIISLVFYFIEIKQLFTFIGSSPSDITGPGLGMISVG